MERITNGRIYSEEPSEEFVSIVRRSLLEYIELHQAVGKTFDYRTVDEAIDILLCTTNQIVIDEQYLLIYTIEDSWFCHDKILSEVLLMRIAKGTAKLSYVINCMEFLAEQHGCTKIQVGTLAQEGPALSRLYHRYGFNELTRVMTKDI